MDRLEGMAVFAAVADERGFAAAARKLRMSPPTVTRLVSELEERLGIRLLARTTRSVTLTDAGSRFLGQTRRILSEVAEAEESARGEHARPVGTLVVSAPVMFGNLHVSGALAAFLGEHPQLAGELRLSDQLVSLVEQGIDVAVRIGALSDSSLVARRVGATRRVLVASPKYLKTAPRLDRPEDVLLHTTVTFTPLTRGADWIFGHAGAEKRITPNARFVTNSANAALGFVAEHGGLTLALGYQAESAIRQKTLRVALERFEPPALPIHLVHPSARFLSAKTRSFIEWVATHCRWDFAQRADRND